MTEPAYILALDGLGRPLCGHDPDADDWEAGHAENNDGLWLCLARPVEREEDEDAEPLDPPYGVIPDAAIAAAAHVIRADIDNGRFTPEQLAEAVLHAAHPHLQPMVPVVDPDAFDAYVVTSTCWVHLTCPRDDCAAEVHPDQFRPADQPLTLGDLMDLATGHEGDAHGGYRPIASDPYGIARDALAGYGTEPYGDLRLNAERASAKVVTALREAGLVDPPFPPEEEHPPVQIPASPDCGLDSPDIDDALGQLIADGLVTATRLAPQQAIAAALAAVEDHTDETALAAAGDVIHALHLAGYTITSQETPQ